MTAFAERYGPWALVAGASVGLGAAYATELSRRGCDVVLVARRAEQLAALAASLPTRTVTVVADLGTPEGLAAVRAATAELEIGVVVANATVFPTGPFVTTPADRTAAAVDLNVRAPLWLAHEYLPAMAGRGRGGFVVMSSLASIQGSPGISVYAATKAFGVNLAEGLWAELAGSGVDVVTCVAGPISTPSMAAANVKPGPGTRTPEQVAVAALDALGRGPRVVPGALMRVTAAVMSRLPRRTAVRVIARSARDLPAG